MLLPRRARQEHFGDALKRVSAVPPEVIPPEPLLIDALIDLYRADGPGRVGDVSDLLAPPKDAA